MELIEREAFMTSLQKHFDNVAGGEGHCVLLCGEAGIGKTALIKAFCKLQPRESEIYQGACDDLFTPRPLAPLYDVLWQVNKERWPVSSFPEDRSLLFSNFFQELKSKKEKLLLVFEDIHWADEGTLDFIRFFIRRIDQLPCLFILTYRDNEVHATHPLRRIFGQLPTDSYSRLVLTPLSRKAVAEMAERKGFSGEEVYSISGGNPFYVNEILASYSPGIPDTIKNSILAVYERQKQSTKNAWQIWSVMPEGLEVEYVPIVKLSWDIDHCFAIGTLTVRNGKVVHKHELFRTTIEDSLMPLKRIELNKMVLDLFLDVFEEKGEIERILHYAKNANEKRLVVKYAPMAARKAASIGAHKEAAKLWLTAIQYSEGSEADQLTEWYEAYAHECFISNQITEAIAYTEKVVLVRKEQADPESCGASLCHLSDLWGFEGDRKNAEAFARQAIDLLENQPVSATKVMAFSTMSRLKMQSDEAAECLMWGEKAVEMAHALGNEEVLSHALNTMGMVQMVLPGLEEKGVDLLRQSLEIALRHAYQEQAARAYTHLATGLIKTKNYDFAGKILEEGIHYCEERDMDFWMACILSWKARWELEKGNWTDAFSTADLLLKNENQPAIVKVIALIVLAKIMMRTGEKEVLALLIEANTFAFKTMQPQRTIPSMVALLEYEWLTGKTVIEKEAIDQAILLLLQGGTEPGKSELAFWMKKAGRHFASETEMAEAYDISSTQKALKAAVFWEARGCPYEQALVLFEGKEEDKRKAIALVQELGATAVYEKLKREMRDQGIKNIPRGIRNSTRANAAFLTNREMDILKLLKAGLHNKEIAEQLFISAKTVDHHISSLLLKLEANSRSKAVAEAVRMGILI